MATHKIEDLVLSQLELPLTHPYVLSLGTLRAFRAALVEVQLEDGASLHGEVVPLPGYLPETLEDVFGSVRSWRGELCGKSVVEARAFVASKIADTPCAASLLACALDMPASLALGARERRVPLVHPLSSTQADLAAAAQAAVENGFRTLKLKVGFDLEADLRALEVLASALPDTVGLRFDANQAYDESSAASFLQAAATHTQVELLEQPLPPDAWDAMSRLCSATRVPCMLDESVRDVADVERAHQIGAKLVKLKLCKQGGATELLQQAHRAAELGLGVVLGNGVATQVSNLLELVLYDRHPGLFFGAAEANGFSKLATSHLPDLRVEAGVACWSAATESAWPGLELATASSTGNGAP